jgi:hypothetical protein
MRKEIEIIGIVAMFACMLTMPASAIFPPDICGEEYYFNDYFRISDITSPNVFGNYEYGNSGNSHGLLNNWMINDYIFDKQKCDVYWDTTGPDYFMCGQWAAHYEWFLENMGFDAKIYTESGHAYVGVKLNDGWHILDPTCINDPGGIMNPPGHSPTTTYNKINYIPGNAETYYDWYDYGLNWGLDRATHDMYIMPEYNPPNDYPTVEYGIARGVEWIIDTNGDQSVDERFNFGMASDIKLSIGDGGICLHRGSEWIIDYDRDGVVDERFNFGMASDTPITFSNGDYGVKRGGEWIIDTNGDQSVDERFKFGMARDTPITW